MKYFIIAFFFTGTNHLAFVFFLVHHLIPTLYISEAWKSHVGVATTSDKLEGKTNSANSGVSQLTHSKQLETQK